MLLRHLRSFTAALAVGGEPHAVETSIAHARVLVGASFLVVFALDRLGTSDIRATTLNLLLGYLGYSIALLLLLRVRDEHTPGFLYAVHAADVLWPTFIALFTDGPNSPFLLFYVFVLFAAAFRWGLRATLATTVLLVATISAVTIALRYRVLEVTPGRFNPNPLLTRTGYLVVTGLLAGYLGQKQKQLRSDAAIVTRLLAETKGNGSFEEVLRSITGRLMNDFGCDRSLLVLANAQSGRTRIWEGDRPGDEVMINSRELSAAERALYSFPLDSGVLSVRCRAGQLTATHFPSEYGKPLKYSAESSLRDLCSEHQVRDALLAVFETGSWSARLVLFDTESSRAEAQARFLCRIVQEVGPAVHNVYLLHRVREQAGAAERAKIARELHDGVVQSLFAVEMRLYSMRKRAGDGEVGKELKNVQDLVHSQLLSLRDMVSEAKAMEITADRLIGFIAESVDRFRRDTDIAAHFESSVPTLELPSRHCSELARIVAEALVNIRKHSGARAVLVQLRDEPKQLRLIIEDDGGGFNFTGRLSLAELDAAGAGPAMIKERVRSIGGSLAIESYAWRGTRIEVSVPKEAYATAAV